MEKHRGIKSDGRLADWISALLLAIGWYFFFHVFLVFVLEIWISAAIVLFKFKIYVSFFDKLLYNSRDKHFYDMPFRMWF